MIQAAWVGVALIGVILGGVAAFSAVCWLIRK